jgi:hypothetical protein
MLALFETRDGLVRWEHVEPLQHRIRRPLMRDLSFADPLASAHDVPSILLRTYEQIEIRRDSKGQEYLYYREVLNE